VNDDATLQVRFMDRVFDNYVMTPMNTLVVDRMRAENERDAKGVADARKMLDVAYGWLKQVRRRRELFRAAGALGLMGFRVVGVEAMDLTELQRNPQWKLFDCRMLLQPAFEKDPELGTAGSILPNPE
jgi:hypothetical protein